MPIPAGSSGFETVVVTNAGDADLVLDPRSNQPEFIVAPGPIVIAPGGEASISVEFVAPVTWNWYEGWIDLGADACGGLAVYGWSLGRTESDLLAAYWDERHFGYFDVEIHTVPATIPGYLVLHRPSLIGNIDGWECRVEPTAPGLDLIGWELAGGGVNLASMPDLVVSLESPLPTADDVVLATFEAVVSIPGMQHVIGASPVSDPVLPGQMSWYSESADQHVAMSTIRFDDSIGSILHDAAPDCIRNSFGIDFGPLAVGGEVRTSVRIDNPTVQPMPLNPTCDAEGIRFSLSRTEIPPYSATTLEVIYAPGVEGILDSVVDLGLSACPGVPLTGIATPAVPGGVDQLGIYFDEAHGATNIDPDGVLPFVPGYLVLKSASTTGGLGGWQCRVQVDGPAEFVGLEVPGRATIFRTLPDVVVSYLEPRPYGAEILLASLYFMVDDPHAYSEISLLPHADQRPEEPMYWMNRPFGLGPRITMFPATGQPLVATINGEGTVAVQLPTPSAHRQARQVELSWHVSGEEWSGFHVYRRLGVDGAAERRTDQPLTGHNGALAFVDDLAGLPGGGAVFYSYAALQDGVEKARSAEVEIDLADLPVARTGLQPNVPNPFNPATEIRFELGRAQKVDVKIYDVTGRLVRTLVDESRAAGPHAEMWQGRDDAGRPVASGAYYVRLITADGVDNRKIMLLK
ncbi:T9SS type A sorting domain-containing protein [bacterium]|nr:T9SS type A sorting domain-containing protein [bacterium]